MNSSNLIYQFRITLTDILLPIWRRIHVPMKYSFWDLHVALQDSMGWFDYHLHVFRFRKPHKRAVVEIGIPDEDMDDPVTLPGWDIDLAEYFTEPGTEPGDVATDEYDFGDGWEHELLLEGIWVKEKRGKYPRCLAGERAGPPEDCGGVPGYQRLLGILNNPKHAQSLHKHVV